MTLLFLKLLAAAVVGFGISLVAKNSSLKAKARLSNLQYGGLGELIKTDIATVVGTFLTIALIFLILGQAINPNNLHEADKPIKLLEGWVVLSKRIIFEAIMALLFSTVGYTGLDIALRIFSVTNRKLNAAIDHKTTIADQVSGTLDKPTPK